MAEKITGIRIGALGSGLKDFQIKEVNKGWSEDKKFLCTLGGAVWREGGYGDEAAGQGCGGMV